MRARLQDGSPPPPDLFVLSATEGKVAAMPNRSGGVGLRLICFVVERLGFRCAATGRYSRDAGLAEGRHAAPECARTVVLRHPRERCA